MIVMSGPMIGVSVLRWSLCLRTDTIGRQRAVLFAADERGACLVVDTRPHFC